MEILQTYKCHGVGEAIQKQSDIHKRPTHNITLNALKKKLHNLLLIRAIT